MDNVVDFMRFKESRDEVIAQAEEMESEEDPDYDAYFGNLLYTKH